MAVITGTLFVFALSIILMTVIRWAVRRKQKHRIFKKYAIPGPRPHFFDGHMRELRKESTPHNLIDSWLKKYGNVFGYFMGEVPYIVVNDTDMIKQILIKDFSVFTNRPDLYMNVYPMSHTVIGLEDQRWKEVRTVLTPTFSTSKMKLMKGIFDKKVDITVDVVRRKARNSEMFDVYSVVQGLTLDVIADCALAMKSRCQQDPSDKLLVAMQNIQSSAKSPAIVLGEVFPILKPLFSVIVNNFTVLSKLNNLVLDNLNQAIAERRKNPQFKSMDILQIMMDSKEEGDEKASKLTDIELMANAYLSLLAGFETTSTALGFIFYLLVKHPEIQERLFREIEAAPDSSYETLQSLRYLGQVIDESMRIYPPVTAFVTRVCKHDYRIGTFTFPQGSVIHIPVWQLHHNPDLFPEPYKFDPDRFSPENMSSIKSMSYLPFGEGPRNCVGARFALLESKLAIFKLLKKFKFVPCERTEDEITLTSPTVATGPANGVWVKAIPRPS